MIKVCKECGKEFETNHPTRKFCYDDHYRKCEACGKLFFVPPHKLNFETHSCSEKCRRDLIARASKNRAVYKCICSVCGKEFFSHSEGATLCDDLHEMICKVCGKTFLVNKEQLRAGKKTCSDECRYKLSNESFMKNIDNHLESYKESMITKYGVSNPMKLQSVKDRVVETSLSKYGKAHFSQTEDFKERSIRTNRERYGKDWYSQTDECKQSIVSTCRRKYGVNNAGKVGSFLVDKMSDPSKLSNLMSFKEDPDRFVSEHFKDLPTLAQLGELCGVRDSSIGQLVDRIGRRDLVRYTYSTMEDDVYQFLTEFIEPTKIYRNTFKVITPYELDVYIPEYKFAIECNPTITHNSSIPGFSSGDSPKPISYHKMKSDMCRSQGIFLFHIFGYDWNHHKDVCKSMIRSLLGHTNNRYFARNLTIKEVSASDSSLFLDANHRQGRVNSKIRLGLYDKDELVSLMTFSKMRTTIGTGKDNLSECWELSRFCSKIDCSVVGGASKLFKHFCKIYQPSRIRSFSDNAHTKGSLYGLLGFHEIRRSDPGYVWVNLKSDRAYARNNAQKKNIKQFLNDPEIDLSKTEREIMIEHGFVQVYDSGTITWEWTKEGDQN